MTVRITRCEAPPLHEMEEPRDLDKPLYVLCGRIVSDSVGGTASHGEFFWEKHEAILPII